MDATTLTWLAFGAIQAVVLVMGGVFVYRAPRAERVVGGASIFVVAGLLLVLLNAAWFWTGGPAGESLIPMRGGVLGAGLSLVTGAEVALIGVLALVRRG